MTVGISLHLVDCLARVNIDDGRVNVLTGPMLEALHTALDQAAAVRAAIDELVVVEA